MSKLDIIPLDKRIFALAERLRDAGHTTHRGRLITALNDLDRNLEDESDDAPDWRPLLHRLRDLEQEGLALLGDTP